MMRSDPYEGGETHVEGNTCHSQEGKIQTDLRDIDNVRERLKTYHNRWTSKTKTDIELATAGFIFTGIGDKVECPSCGIRLYNWQETEDPIVAHKKYAPDCEFMLTRFPQVKAPPKPKKTMSVKYPQYQDYQARLDSFQSWPLDCVAQKPEMMARSGFFYFGSADRARCFHCGVTLRDWDTDDYPPCSHKQWSEHCPFVQTLDVASMTEEIEEWERMERLRIEYEHSFFQECSSSRHANDIVVDGDVETTTSSTISPCSEDSSHLVEESLVEDRDCTDDVISGACNSASGTFVNEYSPAFQAVVDMGYHKEEIYKAIEIRRTEKCVNPDAKSLLEAILDAEG